MKISDISKVIGKGKDRILTSAAIKFYERLKKQNRHDPTATDYLNKIIEAIKADNEEQYSELNQLLGAYMLARQKAGRQ